MNSLENDCSILVVSSPEIILLFKRKQCLSEEKIIPYRIFLYFRSPTMIISVKLLVHRHQIAR